MKDSNEKYDLKKNPLPPLTPYIYRCKTKKADLLKTNQLMNNVLEARLELARTFLPKGF